VVVLSTAFFGGDAISGEFQNRTGYFLVPNPIRRSAIYVGKWVAALAASTIILGIFALIMIANGLYYYPGSLPSEFLESLAFAWFYLVAALSLMFAFSSLFKSTSISILMGVILLLFVFNFVDLLTHGRSESAILYEVARDEMALRQITKQWFERSVLFTLLREASRRGIPALVTSDHGSIHCQTPATVFAKRDATANLRYKFGEDLRAERPEHALLFSNSDDLRLPRRGLGGNTLLAVGDTFFVYPTKLREYQTRYRGSFLHGGVTPEECILPVALLSPRR